MNDEVNAYATLPLTDEEVALLRSILPQFSRDSVRIVERLAGQRNNPRIGEDARCIYVLSAADIESVTTALRDAIAATSASARKQRLTTFLQWIHQRTDGVSVV